MRTYVERASRAQRRLLGVLVAAMISVGVIASPALATPTGEYAPFKFCPLSTTGVIACIYSTTTGGEVKIGSTTVPITNPIVLQGGYKQNETTLETEWVNASGAPTLSNSPENVPGGLLGIMAPEFLPEWLRVIFNEFISHGPTGVTATTELVGTPQFNFFALITGSGPGIVLPTRVKLGNAFLGSGCYVGSSSHPVNLALTTGTTSPPAPNTPITGSLGSIEFRNEANLILDTGNKIVDNSFAAPGASGCDGFLESLVDYVVDLRLGLPSAAGHNTAVLTGNLEQASAPAVVASE
jgi:hypothetical protein